MPHEKTPQHGAIRLEDTPRYPMSNDGDITPKNSTRMPTRNGSPRITIGLPVFNGADYLHETMVSLLGQTYDDYELIVSDNNSTDETSAIVNDFAAQDDRIRYVKHPQNIGAHNNYNSIVPLARGEYFKWVAHDDLMAPGFLEACVAALDSRPEAVLAFPATDQIDGDGKKVGELVTTSDYEHDSAYLRLRAYIGDRVKSPQIFGLMRRSTLMETPLLGNFRGADITFLMEMSMRGRFAAIDDHLFLYRFHDGRYSAQAPGTVRQWYEPHRKSPMISTWRQLTGLLEAIWRVPMPATDRVRCTLFAGYWGIRHARQLAGEILDWLRYWIARLGYGLRKN